MINYKNIVKKHPWIIEKEQKAILSPDSDGLLCGLFMSHFRNWKIVGYYDGKLLALKDGLSAEDCVFLDIDIFRRNVRSIGHHMLAFDKDRLPASWNQYDSCIQPNNLRNYDFKHDFRLKYPLATIHLLLGIIGSVTKVDIQKPAICPLYFVDGTFQVLFLYPENVLDWIKYLGGLNTDGPLNKIFCNEHYSTYDMMAAMDDFFRKRDAICASRQMGPRERGDRLILSDRNGGPYNLIPTRGNLLKIDNAAKERVEQFLDLLASLTSWGYDTSAWTWDNMKLYKFTKGIVKPQVRTYARMISQNPLSFAITSGINLEFTLESPGSLP